MPMHFTVIISPIFTTSSVRRTRLLGEFADMAETFLAGGALDEGDRSPSRQ